MCFNIMLLYVLVESDLALPLGVISPEPFGVPLIQVGTWREEDVVDVDHQYGRISLSPFIVDLKGLRPNAIRPKPFAPLSNCLDTTVMTLRTNTCYVISTENPVFRSWEGRIVRDQQVNPAPANSKRGGGSNKSQTDGEGHHFKGGESKGRAECWLTCILHAPDQRVQNC